MINDSETCESTIRFEVSRSVHAKDIMSTKNEARNEGSETKKILLSLPSHQTGLEGNVPSKELQCVCDLYGTALLPLLE